MSQTHFDMDGKSIRRTLVTDEAELRKNKAFADALQAAFDDPAIIKKYGKCQVMVCETQSRFNAVMPEIESAEGDLWGKAEQCDAIVEYYNSRTGEKFMDV